MDNYRCPSCGKDFSVPDWLDTELKCPNCGGDAQRDNLDDRLSSPRRVEPIKTGLTPAVCSSTKKMVAISFEQDEEGNYGAVSTFPISERNTGDGFGEVTLKNVFIRPDYGGCPYCDDGGSIGLCGSCNAVNCLSSLEPSADDSGQYLTCGKCGVKNWLEWQQITLDGHEDL